MLTSTLKAAVALAVAELSWIASASSNSSSHQWPWHSFKSSPAQPPLLKITKTGPTVPGYLFFAPNAITKTPAPFIVDENGDLVWQGGEGQMFNFAPQFLDTQPVISYWNGSFLSEVGVGYGDVTILNQQYEVVKKITSNSTGINDIKAPDIPAADAITSYLDIHESRLTQDGTIIVTGQNITQTNLTEVGGPEDGWVINSIFYEIDLETNKVLFKWAALDHLDEYPLKNVIDLVPLAGAGKNSSNPWDFFHMNSISKFQDGTYLMNSRHYSTFARILRNGTVAWKCQGIDGGDFKLGRGVAYKYEHDVRVVKEHADGKLDVTMFNNNDNGAIAHPNVSRGLILSVDPVHKTATLKAELIDPGLPLHASSQGSVRNLNEYPDEVDGHYLVGYGFVAYAQEFTAYGEPVLTVQFGGTDEDNYSMSYRVFKAKWAGYPKEKPAIFAGYSGNKTEVYASWNGATEYKVWTVLAGDKKDALLPAGRATRTGFETKITVPGRPKYIRAIASGNNVYGQSEIAAISSNGTATA